MSHENQATLDKVRRLVRAATGEDWGDGYIVTDLAIGYAEPGYGADDAVIVFGNWNPRRWRNDGPVSKADTLPSRLGDAIERAGGHIEWLDEWATCSDCYRAMRTQADSYSWTMFGTIVNDCEPVCADCMHKDIDAYLSDYIDDPKRSVTWLDAADLRGTGWTQYAADDPQWFESGWHEGQDDDPSAILETIKRELPDAMVIFLIDDKGQFDIRFSAWFKDAPAEWGNDD